MARDNINNPAQPTINKLHSEISKVDQSFEAIKEVQRNIKDNPDAFTYVKRVENFGAVFFDKLITNEMVGKNKNGLFGKTKEAAQAIILKQNNTMSAVGKLYSQNLLKFAGARVTGDELVRMNRWNPSPDSSATENQAKAAVEAKSLFNQMTTYRKHLMGVGRNKAKITGNDEFDLETISSLQDNVDTAISAAEAGNDSPKLNKAMEGTIKKLEDFVGKFNNYYKVDEEVPPESAPSAGQGIAQQSAQFTGEVTGDLQRQEAKLQRQDKALTNKNRFTTEELIAEKRRRSGE